MNDDVELVLLRRAESYKKGTLDLWTIYVNASDHPDHDYVARRFVLNQPTTDVIAARTLMEIRAPFIEACFVCMTRAEEDDPVIVETWF